MKLGIIGAGNVGCACAFAAVTRGSAREIVLVNRTRTIAEAVATDLRYGTPLSPRSASGTATTATSPGARRAHRLGRE